MVQATTLYSGHMVSVSLMLDVILFSMIPGNETYIDYAGNGTIKTDHYKTMTNIIVLSYSGKITLKK